MAGQPTKLTDELITEIEQYILKGNYIEVSCQAVGIDRASYYEYLNLAEEARGKAGRGEGLSETEQRLITFSNTVKKAHAQAETGMTEELKTNPQWQRYAWLLERTRNERYGQRQGLEVSAKDPVKITIETVDKREKREK